MATQFTVMNKPTRKRRGTKEIEKSYLDAVKGALGQAKQGQAVALPERFPTPGRASSHGSRVRDSLGIPVRVHVYEDGGEHYAALSNK